MEIERCKREREEEKERRIKEDRRYHDATILVPDLRSGTDRRDNQDIQDLPNK